MYVDITWYVNGLKEFEADAYIVIDVLRFSTTVAAALSSGFSKIYVFSDIGRAIEFSRRIKAPLIAEVEGVKPVSADLDNSPTELVSWVSKYGVGSGELVIRTTSGALIVDEALKLGLKNVFIGSIVNAKYIAKAINELNVNSVNIVCAGYRRTKFSLEDFLGGGAIILELSKLTNIELGDEAIAALHSFESVITKNKLLDVVKLGRHGSFLWKTGRSKDVEFACSYNSLNVAPKVVNGTIIKF